MSLACGPSRPASPASRRDRASAMNRSSASSAVLSASQPSTLPSSCSAAPGKPNQPFAASALRSADQRLPRRRHRNGRFGEACLDRREPGIIGPPLGQKRRAFAKHLLIAVVRPICAGSKAITSRSRNRRRAPGLSRKIPSIRGVSQETENIPSDFGLRYGLAIAPHHPAPRPYRRGTPVPSVTVSPRLVTFAETAQSGRRPPSRADVPISPAAAPARAPAAKWLPSGWSCRRRFRQEAAPSAR